MGCVVEVQTNFQRPTCLHASTPASRFLLAFLPRILSAVDDGPDTEVEETLSSQVAFAYGVYGL